MSVLETPRAIFRGKISWDPVTTNNFSANYDEADAEATICDDGQFVCEPDKVKPVRAAQVKAFRQLAIEEGIPRPEGVNWNPQGTFRSKFFETEICGVNTGTGLESNDPFVSAPARFSGMLIDTEPYGPYSSQLFFDTISFGINGGCRIFAPRTDRFTDRYINFQRNPWNNMIAGLASVLWQTCFPKDAGLIIDAHHSPVLQALKAAMDDEDVLGIMVRWDSYLTVYYDDPTLSTGSPDNIKQAQALINKLNGGGFQPNPARSDLVGSIGLWRKGEPAHEPGDRALLSTGVAIPNAPARPAKSPPPAVASAFVRANSNSIAIDLSNSIPEINRVGEKCNLGELQLIASDPPPAVARAVIATIGFDQYNQAAYQANCGIIDIPVESAAPGFLDGLNLSLEGTDGTVYLQEQPLRAIPTRPNIYINQGDEINAAVQVYDRGKPAGAGVKVTMTAMAEDPSIQNPNPPVPLAYHQTTDANGQVQFPLIGVQGSVTGLVLQSGPNPTLPVTAGAFNCQTETYMYLRVLPADEKIAAMAPTWDNVYNWVLSRWDAMAPCMDNWLVLSDEEQVKSHASIIKKLTDSANFEAYRYMPVTRDMTVGQRTLLYNFLDETAFEAEKSDGANASAQQQLDRHKLARSLRSA